MPIKNQIILGGTNKKFHIINRCSNCSIGIGKSFEKIDGKWSEFEHTQIKPNYVRKGTRKYKFCDSCFEHRKQKNGSIKNAKK